MAIDVTVRIDDAKVQAKLAKLSKDTGVSIGFICEDQLRLWTADMMRLTAPRKLSTGRLTVAAGVAELFKPLDNAAAFQHWLDDLESRGTDTFRTLKNGGKSKMRVGKAQLKRATLQNMKEFHAKHRTAKGGVKLSGANRQDAWGGKMIVPRASYAKLQRELQKNVGLLKAGWVPALRYYSGRTNATAKIPSWVDRQAVKRGYTAGTINKNGDGFVAAINAVTYANSRINQDGLLQITSGKRQRDLTNGGFKRMSELAERFNAG